MIKIFETLLELIYPNVCGVCEEINKESLCEDCKKRIDSITIAKIDHYKNDNAKYFDTHAYIFKYNGQIRKMILNYKFNEKAYLYKTFIRIILDNEKICDFINSFQLIIPVPIHKKRYYGRGYNQSELLAKEISKNFQNAVLKKEVLVKVKNNTAQSTLKKKDRVLNVKEAYKVRDCEILKNKSVLLVDDIYTTGNTANECARMLKLAGAKEIGIFTIAKD